ncbi:MAG TPA: PQQ-binding-like beta-propeller repeat protein, partial [Planctomycetaceae bacterium]|nr:PQQ-binding-like beta-propeller repeat protein [Planctomycetaceae bacterium]
MLARSMRFGLVVAVVLAAGSLPQPAAAQDPLDWPYWRGPEMNGVSREKNLPSSWSPEGENLVWKSEALGTRSTPIVMREKLYTLARHNPATLEEAEKVICADAETGEILWEHVFNVFLTDVPDTRVGWSCVVGDPETGNVFAHGVCGTFICLDGNGKLLWSRSLSEEFGMLSTYGGRTNMPIVHENLVITSGVIIGWGEMAKPTYRILAFDKRNGECVWFTGTRPFPEDTTYSGPVLAVINGQAQFIVGSGDGSVYGLQPRTGKIIWNYDVSLRGINTAPVVAGNLVLCGHSEENLDSTKMGALFAIDASKSGNITKTGEVWRTTEEFIGKTQPVIVGDRVYSIDDSGNFFVNDMKTGKIVGRQKLGTMGRASPLYADGKFYVADATGRFYVFEPEEAKGLKKLHQLRLDSEINGSPIVSHGRIYLPTEGAMYCIGTKDGKPSADPLPKMEPETPKSADGKAATALVVPVEALMKPGQKQKYQVFLYNANGQYVGAADPAKVKFTIDGKGTVGADGRYVSEAGEQPYAAIINAEIDGLKAQARVRLIPDLPWSFTFDDGVVPITAVGMRYRHVGLDFDLYQSLKKANLLAARCYLALTTQFTNVPAPVAKYDDTTPAQAWTGFKRFLGHLEDWTNQDEAKAALDPALKMLQDEGVIAKWEWTGTSEIGTQLQVTKVVRKVKGNGVICKITTIPKGTRSQGWLGRPDTSNYEIQADLYAEGVQLNEAADKNAKLADMGLICQRYRFDMQGASQKLKLYSWIPHDQKYHDRPFEWSADTWYTMKFRVTTSKKDDVDVALLQGKVWKRDEEEPKEWSTEWTDSPANLVGSPGLFGNAGNTEIFIDNVKVTP